MPRGKTSARIFVEQPEGSPGVPDDAVTLDPDAQRAAELEAEQVAPEDIEELFRVSDEMRSTGGVVLQFTRTLPVVTAGYVGEMAPAEFTLDRVRREFGVGTYRVRCMGPRGYVPGGGKLVIAPVPEKVTAPQSSVQDLLAIIEADKAKKSDDLQKWAAILSPLLAPVLANLFAPRGSQVTELVQGLAALKGLQPEVKEPEPLSKQLQTIAGVMGQLKELSGDDKSATGATWIDLIRDAITGVKPVLEGIATRAMVGRMPGAAMPGAAPMPGMMPAMLTSAPLPAPTASAPASPPTAQPTSEAPASVPGNDAVIKLLQWLAATIDQLVVQAARSRDPALYAEVVLDNVPEGADLKQFRDFLGAADWWQKLTQFAPGAAPYQGWFSQFREAALELLDEQIVKPQAPRDSTAEDDRRFGQPHFGHDESES